MAKSIKTKEVDAITELSIEDKILNYVANSNLDIVDLTPLLRSLYPIPTMQEPPVYLLQNESKKLKALFSSMVASGMLTLADGIYLQLGKPYWKDGDSKTSHHTINTLKICAVK